MFYNFINELRVKSYVTVRPQVVGCLTSGDEISHVMTVCHSAKYFVFRRENDVCAYTSVYGF